MDFKIIGKSIAGDPLKNKIGLLAQGPMEIDPKMLYLLLVSDLSAKKKNASWTAALKKHFEEQPKATKQTKVLRGRGGNTTNDSKKTCPENEFRLTRPSQADSDPAQDTKHARRHTYPPTPKARPPTHQTLTDTKLNPSHLFAVPC